MPPTKAAGAATDTATKKVKSQNKANAGTNDLSEAATCSTSETAGTKPTPGLGAAYRTDTEYPPNLLMVVVREER